MDDLKTRLTALGFKTREQRADAVRVTLRTLESYEQGRRDMPAYVLERLESLEREQPPDLVRLGLREAGRGWVTWREEMRDLRVIRSTDSGQALNAIYPTKTEALRQLRIEALGAREAWRAGDEPVRVEVDGERAERLTRAQARRRYPEIFADQRVDLSISAEYAYSTLCDNFAEYEAVYEGEHSLCGLFQHGDGSWVCAGAKDEKAGEYFIVVL